MPRAVILDYMQGRWKKYNLKQGVDFNTKVKNVRFNVKANDFTVTIENLVENTILEDNFDYVIVASGHFTIPNVPKINGVENFTGRILHSHDLRNFEEFRGKKVLIVSHKLYSLNINVLIRRSSILKSNCFDLERLSTDAFARLWYILI